MLCCVGVNLKNKTAIDFTSKIVLFRNSRELYLVQTTDGESQASPGNKGERLTIIRFQEEIGQGYFEQKFNGEQKFKIVASYWLQAEFSAFLLGQGKLFRFQKTRDKISLRKKFSFVLEVTFF